MQVDFTLGVNANGLPTGSGSEYAVLQDAKAKGVKVSVVNIMTMDFYDGSNNDLGDAESAARATAGQLSSLYGISTSAAYAMMGLTPIAGTNDDGTVFSTSNASSLESFAASNGVAGAVLLGGRRLRQGDRLPVLVDLQQDHRRRRHHSAAHRNHRPITGYQGLCLDDRSASTANFNPIQVYTCNGTNAQSWTVNSNGTLTVLGNCLDVDAARARPTAPRRPVSLQRHRRPGLGPPVQRRARQHQLRQVPRRHRLRRLRHPGADLGLRRQLQPAVEHSVKRRLLAILAAVALMFGLGTAVAARGAGRDHRADHRVPGPVPG